MGRLIRNNSEPFLRPYQYIDKFFKRCDGVFDNEDFELEISEKKDANNDSLTIEEMSENEDLSISYNSIFDEKNTIFSESLSSIKSIPSIKLYYQKRKKRNIFLSSTPLDKENLSRYEYLLAKNHKLFQTNGLFKYLLKFYKRQKHFAILKNSKFKKSRKLRKLIKDSRGTKKYLVDYDRIMSFELNNNQSINSNIQNDSGMCMNQVHYINHG